MTSKARLLQAVGVQASACFACSPGFPINEASPASVQPKGWTPTLRILTLLIVAHSSTLGLLAADLPRVPPGFTITRVTTPEMVQHPTMACFDDRGRLYVCESAGTNAKAGELLKNPQDKIVRLEDTDGDGVFDKSVVFAEKLVFPQGVLWHEGVVYTCSSPYLWKLEDTDNDGVCDKRTVLVKSFGFSGNAADIHGPFLGPEGRLWWCDGRHGHEIRTDQKGLAGGQDNALDIPPKPEPGLPNPDGTLLSKGKAARIFNCRLDGTDVQTFCGGGMDNPVEIDFWETGEVIGTVNLFHGQPRGDCLVHWVWGGVYPRADQQACIDEFPRTVGLLDEIVDYGHVAVSGLCKYRGEQLGKGWDQSVFVTMFNTHKVVRTILERSGSTFKAAAHEDFLVSDDPDFHPTDVLEDADGGLLVIDTGGWFRIGCPASKVAKPQIGGGIYRVRKDGSHGFQDPYGQQVKFTELPLENLLQSLSSQSPVIQSKALAEVRRRSSNRWKGETAKNRADQLRGLWSQGALTFQDFSQLTRDGRSLDAEDFRHQEQLQRRQLVDGLVRVIMDCRDQFFGRLTTSLAAGGLLFAIDDSPADAVLEHAVIDGLRRSGVADSQLLRDYRTRPRLARAVLIAIDQDSTKSLSRDDVLPLLTTQDSDLQRTVFDVISRHEGWAAEVVDLIGQWLNESTIPDDRRAIIRRFLAARAGESSVQTLIATQFARTDLPQDVRQTLLESIAEANLTTLPANWTPGLRSSLHSEPSSQRLVIAAALRHKVSELSSDLNALSDNSNLPADLRIAAMEVFHVRDQQPLNQSRFQLLRSQIDSDGDPVLRATAARVLADSPLSSEQLLVLVNSLDASHAVLAPTLLRAFDGSKDASVGAALVQQLAAANDSLSLPASELTRVFKSYPESVQSQAAPLLAARGVDPAKQAARLADLTEATKTGNARAGREVFFSNKALCSRCHRVNNQGETIGPDLSMVGAIRQHHELVEAVIEPSASFVRSYRPVILATADGRTHTGIIASESSTEITLRTSDFAELRIPRSEIEAFKESDLSIMPAGVDQRLTRTELADLIAYLASLKERKSP